MINTQTVRAILLADDAINRAREQSTETLAAMRTAMQQRRFVIEHDDGELSYIYQAINADSRQLHRQHCQPEKAPIDWSGIGIAAVIVFILAAVVIGSTIDFKGL